MNILIENCKIVSMSDSAQRVFEGTVGVNGRKIAMVSSCSDGDLHTARVEQFVAQCGDDLTRVDGEDMALMPGFVNTHGHTPMSLMRGYADDIPLFKWLSEYVWPFEAKMGDQETLIGAQLSMAEMLLGGTTTFVDMYWRQPVVAGAVGRSGIRGVLSPALIDSNVDVFKSDLRTLMDEYVTPQTFDGRVTAMVGPHSPYTCSEDTLRLALQQANRYDLHINIHLAETRDEMEIVRKKYGCTPVELLRNLGIFSRPTLAVHSVWMDGSDIKIMHGSGVSVAHNPQSNMKLASGIAPIAAMLDEGITVGLGTDSSCSNNDLDMWEEMRSASLLQKVATGDPTVLPAYDTLRMATIEGAKAIGLGDRIGSIEEGKLADMILVDLRKTHLTPVKDLIANLVYCGKASDVAMTIVNGEIVVRDGKCLTMDACQIARQAQECLERIG